MDANIAWGIITSVLTIFILLFRQRLKAVEASVTSAETARIEAQSVAERDKNSQQLIDKLLTQLIENNKKLDRLADTQDASNKNVEALNKNNADQLQVITRMIEKHDKAEHDAIDTQGKTNEIVSLMGRSIEGLSTETTASLEKVAADNRAHVTKEIDAAFEKVQQEWSQAMSKITAILSRITELADSMKLSSGAQVQISRDIASISHDLQEVKEKLDPNKTITPSAEDMKIIREKAEAIEAEKQTTTAKGDGKDDSAPTKPLAEILKDAKHASGTHVPKEGL